MALYGANWFPLVYAVRQRDVQGLVKQSILKDAFFINVTNVVKLGHLSTKYQQSELGNIFWEGSTGRAKCQPFSASCLARHELLSAFAEQTNKPFLKHKKLGRNVQKLPQEFGSPYKSLRYSATGH